jgi:hypothetical protein
MARRAPQCLPRTSGGGDCVRLRGAFIGRSSSRRSRRGVGARRRTCRSGVRSPPQLRRRSAAAHPHPGGEHGPRWVGAVDRARWPAPVRARPDRVATSRARAARASAGAAAGSAPSGGGPAAVRRHRRLAGAQPCGSRTAPRSSGRSARRASPRSARGRRTSSTGARPAAGSHVRPASAPSTSRQCAHERRRELEGREGEAHVGREQGQHPTSVDPPHRLSVDRPCHARPLPVEPAAAGSDGREEDA